MSEFKIGDRGDDEKARFEEHLKRAQKLVSTWPIWMQTVLGGPPLTDGDSLLPAWPYASSEPSLN